MKVAVRKLFLVYKDMQAFLYFIGNMKMSMFNSKILQGTMNWMPFSKKELENVIAFQCKDMNEVELTYFNKIKVTLELVKIVRCGKAESVFLVAKEGSAIVFYDDIEEGFEIAEPNENGAISDYGASQFTLKQVINGLCARSL